MQENTPARFTTREKARRACRRNGVSQRGIHLASAGCWVVSCCGLTPAVRNGEHFPPQELMMWDAFSVGES